MQINDRFAERSEKRFEKSTVKILELISKNPYLYEATAFDPNIRRALIDKLSSVFYEVKEDRIQVLFFWDNRQQPMEFGWPTLLKTEYNNTPPSRKASYSPDPWQRWCQDEGTFYHVAANHPVRWGPQHTIAEQNPQTKKEAVSKVILDDFWLTVF